MWTVVNDLTLRRTSFTRGGVSLEIEVEVEVEGTWEN
jgi:hypothetical protein